MFPKKTVFPLVLLLSSALFSTVFASGLDSLSGSWDNLDQFVSLNNCISAPSLSGVRCSPSQIYNSKKGQLQFLGFLTATNSALELSDSVKKERFNSSDVSNFFAQYNYSEFLVTGKLQYISPSLGLAVGVTPVRYQGKLQLHNPNLPFVSLLFRDDMQFHASQAHRFEWDQWGIELGATGTLLIRKEVIVETTLVDLAARPLSDIVQKRPLRGSFFDLSTSVHYQEILRISAQFYDLGGYWGGKRDQSSRYLFIDFDRSPRGQVSASTTHRLGYGKLTGAAGLLHWADHRNNYSQQWTASLAYYLGPVRFLSGVGDKLLRTGLGMSFGGYDVAVAQEWLNRLESGRSAQPRFTLSVSAAL